MSRNRFTPEEIAARLRRVDMMIAHGATVAESARAIGLTKTTYFRWRRDYGAPANDQAKQSASNADPRIESKVR